MAEENTSVNTIDLATELTIAWLNNPNNRVSAEEVPAFIQRMHATLNGLSNNASGSEEPAQKQEYTPAVTARKSLSSPDHIISMIDGKPYKTLRRHLSGHGLTPEQYRERYKLKADYPMVAPNYSEQRRSMAHKIGLGAKGRQARAAAAPVPTAESAPATPKGGGRKAGTAASKPARAPRKRAPKAV